MDKIEGTKVFLEIINTYKHEDFIMKRIFKNIITKNNEDNVREVLLERNKNVNKHEMEEDEAEKLTNLGSNSNNPQKFKSANLNLPDQQKRKIDRKEILKYLNKGNNSKQEITSNFFDTSINNISKNINTNLKTVSYNNFLNRGLDPKKLETIYEKNKTDPNAKESKEKKNKKMNHYKKNLLINNPSEFLSDIQELNGLTKKQRVQSNYTYTDSVETTCDSRLPSGFKPENDPFISIIDSADITSSIFLSIFFIMNFILI